MEKPTKIFNHLLKDFESNLDYKENWVDNGNGTKSLKRFSVKLPTEMVIRHPFIVFLMFAKIKKYPILGRFEKVLWEIPILYKGIPFVLAHRKFGFSISGEEENEEINKIGVEAISLILKAIPFTEALIKPIVNEKVKGGKITIESKYTKVKNRYLFFREKITEQNSPDFEKLKFLKSNFDVKNFKDGESFHEYYIALERQNSYLDYYFLSMIDAYFSMLEHICILLIPFVKSINMKEIELDNYISQNWKAKLKIVLQIKTNKNSAKYLEILDEIKEQIRNPASHGDYHKNGNSFYVHMENLGAIPFTLTKSKTNYKFSETSKSRISIENVIKHFDDFENYLETSETKYGMMYIKRDLPVAFDKNSVTTLRRRTRTEKSTTKYIEDTVKELENAMNMDW